MPASAAGLLSLIYNLKSLFMHGAALLTLASRHQSHILAASSFHTASGLDLS